MVHILDLDFRGFPNTIAAFLIPSDDGPILVETGPHSCLGVLEKRVKEVGFALSDIKNVFLSHIHLDHAGAAWALARQGATIYVHPAGAPHMIDPTKLLNSAKRIYQDQMEVLWGDLQPIDSSRLIEIQDEEEIHIANISLKAIYTPGHAVHHIAWKFGENIFCGDIAGVRITGGPVMPPCPPPDINLEDWISSIDLVQAQNPKGLFLTHFGWINYDVSHFIQLKSCLMRWGQWIKERWQNGKSIEETTPVFEAYVKKELMSYGASPEVIDKYQIANPYWMSVAGLFRYWSKKTPS